MIHPSTDKGPHDVQDGLEVSHGVCSYSRATDVEAFANHLCSPAGHRRDVLHNKREATQGHLQKAPSCFRWLSMQFWQAGDSYLLAVVNY